MEDVNDMNREMLIGQILSLRIENERLKEKLREKSWEGQVDRQGGSHDWRDTFYDEWSGRK